MTTLEFVGDFLRQRQRWVLIVLLMVLHLTLLAGVNNAIGLMCWLVDVGLFLLWQPFIQAERRLGYRSLGLIVVLLAGCAWLYGWWLLILWVIVLAALLGGRVMMLGHRPTRIFFLLAFGYLLAALLVWLVPRIVPDASLIGPSLDPAFAWAAPAVFALMLMLPRPREIRMASGGTVDFFYSLFIFLLISVLVLGTLAFMLLRRSFYLEAVFMTVVGMGAMLLLIAWAWAPRPGFSGIGVFLSRYLLTLGLPFEDWLQRLVECAEGESDPERFLSLAFERMLELPWVLGVAWGAVPGAQVGRGIVGEKSPCAHEFASRPLALTLYTRHQLSPALLWHFQLLARLTNEYYVAKQRARELQQMSYVQAVHETGARLTHDVKNLLQSLNNLCFVVQTTDEAGKRLNQLVQRQLPQITQRLQQTLEKLQAPQDAGVGSTRRVAARTWWNALQQRYANDRIDFSGSAPEANVRLPALLFDSVADNLIHNALLKRQSESAVVIRARLADDASWFSVSDNGSVIAASLAGSLLQAPVPSENGFGIGLYHAARLAERHGYALRLASNVPGEVRFELSLRAD